MDAFGSVSRDHAGLQVLPHGECLRLAATRPVGRVAFGEAGNVEVFPVNHCVLDGMVAFRTADGSKLGAAIQGSVVAYEVDDYDADRHTGWSVVLKGRVEAVTSPALLARLRGTGLQPWSDRVPRPTWVVLRPETVTGRRL